MIKGYHIVQVYSPCACLFRNGMLGQQCDNRRVAPPEGCALDPKCSGQASYVPPCQGSEDPASREQPKAFPQNSECIQRAQEVPKEKEKQRQRQRGWLLCGPYTNTVQEIAFECSGATGVRRPRERWRAAKASKEPV